MRIVMLNNKVLMSGNQMALYIPPIVPKGSLVKMNLDGTERQYRVLSVNGNVCKVMGMWDDFRSKYNKISTTTAMGTLTVQKYEGSTLDTYLNTTWYNTLTSTAKAAIVPENVVCDAWYYGSTGDPDYTGTYGTAVPGTNNYTISKYAGGTLNIGNRNVFALGVQDVIDYLNDSSVQVDTTAILRNVNIWKMFWNMETKPTTSTYPWLRSSRADYSNYAWGVGDSFGRLSSSSSVDISSVVRPALNLDMSKIQYTLVQAPPVIETETWVIKDNAPVDENSYTLNKADISFTSGGEKFVGIEISGDGIAFLALTYYRNDNTIKQPASFDYSLEQTQFYWDAPAYKTLVFDTPPTGDLLTWLQANATKQ